MVGQKALLAAVEAAFEQTALGLRRWDDPHADRDPTDDEYSRCLDPAKWSIVVARAEAWAQALQELELADVERGATVRWAHERDQAMDWAAIEVLRPRASDCVPLVFAFRSWGDCIDLNCVTIGAGDPVVELVSPPGCGCDACDHGSQVELDALDAAVLEVLMGGFRYLWRDDRSIRVTSYGRSTANIVDDDEIEAALADPTGWNEVRGAAWLPG